MSTVPCGHGGSVLKKKPAEAFLCVGECLFEQQVLDLDDMSVDDMPINKWWLIKIGAFRSWWQDKVKRIKEVARAVRMFYRFCHSLAVLPNELADGDHFCVGILLKIFLGSTEDMVEGLGRLSLDVAFLQIASSPLARRV